MVPNARSPPMARSAPVALALALCCTTSPAVAPPIGSVRHGIDTAGMDTGVAPGTDFFAYANGTWLKRTSIPPDRAAYGTGAIVTEATERRSVELIQSAAEGRAAPGSDARKVGDFYASFMDEGAIEAAGLRPL